MGLPAKSVNKPVTISMIFLGVVLLGAISLTRLPVELLPNYSFGVISIFTNIRGGMPPSEVESLVGKPIEEAVGGATHLKNIISISEEGNSTVQMWFEPGIDMDLARLEVSEKFSRVKAKLPNEAERPIIAKYDQAQYPILILAVTGEGYTPEALRRIADDEIKDRIQRVPGVANVEIGGGRERKILVEARQPKLQAHRVPILQVVNTLNTNNLNLLLGEVKRPREKVLVRALGEAETMDEIGAVGVAVTPSGSVIKVKDVADVKDSFLEAVSYARLNVLPVVNLYIQKESAANTVSTNDGIQHELKKIESELGPKIRLITTYNQAESIKRAIRDVNKALLEGAILSALILLFFLRDLRAVLIVSLAIPISVISTFAFMYLSRLGFKGLANLTLNVSTLGGLVLGIGMLVDNSIVVLENIFVKRGRGMIASEAAVSGSEEMFLPIVASTLATLVVFLPIIFLSKETRLIYGGLALTVVFSLVASLIVAVSLVPMLSAKLSGGGPRGAHLHLLKQVYRRLAGFTIRYRWVFIALLLGLFVMAAGIFAFRLEKEFIESAELEDVTVFVELPTGAKLGASDEVVKKVEKILSGVPEVKTFTSRVEAWSSKIYVKLVPVGQRRRSTKEVIGALRPEFEKIQPAFIYFEEPQEVEAAEVILELYGFDYDTLTKIADQISQRLQKVEGLTDVKIRHRPGRPEYRVVLDKKKAAGLGLTMEEVANFLHASMRGLRATLYHSQGKEIEVIVRLAGKDRRTKDDLKKLTIILPDGREILLSQIAQIEQAQGPSKIWRKNKNRMIQVSANKGRHAFGTAVDLIRKAIADVPFPEGSFYKFGENYDKLVENQRQSLMALLLALVLVYLVLASLFESFAQPLLILFTVPLGLIGVVLVLRYTHTPVSMAVFIGCMILGGVVVNTAIIMVDHINHLRERGYGLVRSAIQGGSDRMRPILMTSLTTILGLLPMALSRSPEALFLSRVSLVFLAGLTFSAILKLLFLPAFYLAMEDIKRLRALI